MPIRVDNNVKNQKTTPALYSDVYANIPAFGQTGRLFFATDTNTIYRDTGSAWVVFLANATVPSGLSPVGGNGTFIQSNGSSLQYVSLAATTPLNIAQVGSTVTYSIQQSSALQAGYLSAADFTTFNSKVGGTGTANTIAKFSASGTVGNSSITDSGTVIATTSEVRIGTAPGTTYKVEIDGGLNLATGHEYRKNGVDIFNTTNNGIPKFNSTTKVFNNSNITDNGTSVLINSQTAIGSAATAGILFDVNTNYTSINSVGVRSSSAITVAGGTGTAEYFKSIASYSGGAGIYTSIKHFTATQASLGSLVTPSQYGFFVDSSMIGGGINYGFYADLASSGGNRYNFYANGTAPNLFKGACYYGNFTTTNFVTAQIVANNAICVQNSDFVGGSTGSYGLFNLSATSGNGLILDIESKSSGGTQSSVIRLNKQGTGNVIVGTIASPANQFQLSTDSAGKPSTSTWTIVSDNRVKTDITPYTKGLTEILQINPVEYKYNGKAGFDAEQGGIGIIAQDIQTVLPETINTFMAKLNEKDKKDTELLNFNSHALTFVLINAIKELKAEIDLLKQN